jgi:hypothetical protein
MLDAPIANNGVGRRDFLRASVAIAAAALLSKGCTAYKKPRSAEGEEQARSLVAELSHPFHQNARGWLARNQHMLPKIFDVSGAPVREIHEYCVDDGLVVPSQPGVRIRRTAGSNILVNEREHVQNIEEHLDLVAHEQRNTVCYCAFSHEKCGACAAFAKIKGKTDGHPDELGIEEIKNRVSLIQKEGFAARYAGHINFGQMRRPKSYHPAAMAIVDGTAGRLQNHHPAGLPYSYVVSTHDQGDLKVTAPLCAQLAGHITAGYGEDLKEFTYLVFEDPKLGGIARTIRTTLNNLDGIPAGMRLKVITAEAPSA